MTIPRIYSPESLQDRTTCALEADNLRYLKMVLRLKQNDKIILFDGFGHEFEAVIQKFSPCAVDVKLGKKIPQAENKICVTLAQAVPKAAKMDLIVKSSAELGVDLIVPFMAKRSVSRIAADKALLKVSRWQKIARESSRCSRASPPFITEKRLPVIFTAAAKSS